MKIFQTNHLPGRTVSTPEGGQFLWFSGTDYLGMGHNEAFRTYLSEGLDLYGNHFGSSRNNSLRLEIFEECEVQFSKFTGADSALLISSGMLAGQLLMREIEHIVQSYSDLHLVRYHYAPRVHPAIWGKDYVPLHGSWNSWAKSVVDLINTDLSKEIHIICTDAIGSPMVERFNFSIFDNIENPENVWLIIDESHTLGVYGQDGAGVSHQINALLRQKTIFLSSLNKALGVPGGMIWGEKLVTDTLRKSPWFAGASPPAPAYIYTLKRLLESGTYRQASTVLTNHIAYLTKILSRSELFLSIPGYPVLCSQNAALFDHLLSHGIMASCFSYPLPTDIPVTRLAISAVHQKEDLDRLAEVCDLM